ARGRLQLGEVGAARALGAVAGVRAAEGVDPAQELAGLGVELVEPRIVDELQTLGLEIGVGPALMVAQGLELLLEPGLGLGAEGPELGRRNVDRLAEA